MSDARPRVFTAGHSTRSGAELVGLLRAFAVEAVADVRRFPSSRHHPQFNRGTLHRALAASGMRYVWLGETLGGRLDVAPADADSPNTALSDPGLRAYADAMAAAPFCRGLAELETLARSAPTAVLCAERDWRRCHRQLLADALVARGWRVVHLVAPDVPAEEHRLTAYARVDGGRVSYPGLL